MVKYYPECISSQLEQISARNSVDAIGEVSYGSHAFPIYAMTSQNPSPQLPWVCITAGVHYWPERAATDAVLDFMIDEGINYSKFFNFQVVALVNPSSSVSKGRSNLLDQNINRHFNDGEYCQEASVLKEFFKNENRRFVLAWDPHENGKSNGPDSSEKLEMPEGIYLYENCDPQKSIGKRILGLACREGIPVFDKPYIDEGDYMTACDKGLILNSYLDRRENWMALDEYMLNHSDHTFTFETPTCWSLESRIDAHKKVLCATLDTFISERR